MTIEMPDFVKNWDLAWYYWVAIAGGIVVFVAIVLYFLGGGRLKIPESIAVSLSTVFCLIGGIAAGMGAMYTIGYHWEKQPDQPAAQGGPGGGGGGMMGGGGGGGMMGGMMGGGGGMMGGGGGGKDAKGKGQGGGGGGMMGGGMMGGGPPSAKAQLGTLVRKLDQLTGSPFNFELKPEIKKTVNEQLKGLKELEELSNDEATKRIDAVKAVIVKDEPTNKALTALGFNWPGDQPQRPSPPSNEPNPFKEDKSLVALQKRLNGQ